MMTCNDISVKSISRRCMAHHSVIHLQIHSSKRVHCLSQGLIIQQNQLLALKDHKLETDSQLWQLLLPAIRESDSPLYSSSVVWTGMEGISVEYSLHLSSKMLEQRLYAVDQNEQGEWEDTYTISRSCCKSWVMSAIPIA
jgi:hypothetical protein